jgi:hypothetical protein
VISDDTARHLLRWRRNCQEGSLDHLEWDIGRVTGLVKQAARVVEAERIVTAGGKA